MSVLHILHYPDERLRKIALPVQKFDKTIQRIVNDMLETMYKKDGIGLAATQINIHQRIIVIDVSKSRNKNLILINPVILEKSGATSIEEGCLSIPKQRALVPRAKWVKITALDISGSEFALETNNLLAICIQHEIDHLNGKLFMDYLSVLKRQRIKRKTEKIKRLNNQNTKQY